MKYKSEYKSNERMKNIIIKAWTRDRINIFQSFIFEKYGKKMSQSEIIDCTLTVAEKKYGVDFRHPKYHFLENIDDDMVVDSHE